MSNYMRGEVTDLSFVVVFSACGKDVVHVLIDKRSFESFMCLDLILERWQSFSSQILVQAFVMSWL